MYTVSIRSYLLSRGNWLIRKTPLENGVDMRLMKTTASFNSKSEEAIDHARAVKFPISPKNCSTLIHAAEEEEGIAVANLFFLL